MEKSLTNCHLKRERTSGTLLFMGRIVEPEWEEAD